MSKNTPNKFTIPKKGIFRETLTINGIVVSNRTEGRDMTDTPHPDEQELFRLASLIGCEPEDEERHRQQLLEYVAKLRLQDKIDLLQRLMDDFEWETTRFIQLELIMLEFKTLKTSEEKK